MRPYIASFWTRFALLLSLLLSTLTVAAPVENTTLIESRATIRDVPGVREIKLQMQSWGIVSTLPSVFFTNWPIALNTAQNWARDEFDEDIGATKENWKFAVWGRLLPGDWLSEVAMELEDQMQAAGYSTDRKKKYQDLFLKNISQAFGELANGDIIVLVGDEAFPDNNWKADTAWGGWEYPALTRNPNVDRILRVDPSKCEGGRVVWEQGQGPSAQKPKGKEESTRPRKHL